MARTFFPLGDNSFLKAAPVCKAALNNALLRTKSSSAYQSPSKAFVLYIGRSKIKINSSAAKIFFQNFLSKLKVSCRSKWEKALKIFPNFQNFA